MTAKKVLVADDEQDCVAFLKKILTREGMDVVTAGDGEEALQKVQDENPDMLFLDVQMPKLNGFEVFEKIRKSEQTKELPIVMLTGIKEKTGLGFSADEMGQFFGKKPSDYIEKPISPDKVVAAAKKALGL